MTSPDPAPTTAPTSPRALLEAARAARAAGELTKGCALAGDLWSTPGTDAATKAEAGYLLAFFHFRLGDLEALLAIGDLSLPLLDTDAFARRRQELLRWLTLGACELGRFALALSHAQASCEKARLSGDPGETVSSLTALGVCFERMGDPWQAERLMSEALAVARAHGGVYELTTTLNNLCAVTIGAYYLLRDTDDVDEARAVLQRSLDYAREAATLAPAMGDATFDVIIWGNLGELLLHLEQRHEAIAWLDAALSKAREGGYRVQAWRIRCSVGEFLVVEGRHQEALVQLHALLDDMAESGMHATFIRVHHALYRACAALGRDADALRHLERYGKLERQRAINQLKSQSQLFVTRMEAEQARLQADNQRMEAQRQRLRADEFEERSLRDALTGLGNRRLLDLRLPALLAAAEENAEPLAVAVIDIDHFKRVNDRHGHALGDRVLVVLAQKLEENTRAQDLAIRVGGEEFVIVLPNTTVQDALEVCERLRDRVAHHAWELLAPGLAVTVSVGVAYGPPYDRDALFDQADRALYDAKRGGRDLVLLTSA